MGIGMEEIIASLLEKSLIGGAFLFLLYFLVNKCIVQLENISNSLVAVSNTLVHIDNRIILVEKRLDKLENRKDDK